MLSLKNITKDYDAGGTKISALKGIDIDFRENEFVSILGPSGCGKTTTLNIIGGLDHYTNGDLIIDGKSTKDYKDRDWDTYRNHKIGFIFQNYNLIPHLSVIKNVEIAMSMNNTKAKERRERAIEVLEQVGLKDQINKMPNQLSGGQMQRVAIARALANDPEIILADEPTGALDSKTSVQVMDILKKISNHKLIIMVTHNQELANQYSTRIINMLDGKKVGDSNPIDKKELKKLEKEQNKKLNNPKKENKSSMSFLNALGLSFKNLLTKKGRTFLTAFAGSIGIIGIALVLAISNGFSSYIQNMQSSTLSGYPVSVSTATIDYGKLSSFELDDGSQEADPNKISIYKGAYDNYIKYGHYNYLGSDFLNAVRNFERTQNDKGGNSNINLIQYNYFTPVKIVAKQSEDKYVFTANSNDLSLLSGSGKGIFYEALSNEEYMLKEYGTVYTSPNYNALDDNGLTLVLEKGNRLSNSILQALGIELDSDSKSISFEEVCSRQLKLVYNNDYYINDGSSFSTIDTTDQTVLKNLYDSSSSTLQITRIIAPKQDSQISILQSGIMYSSNFASEYRENCKNSEIAVAQNQLYQSQEGGNTGYTFYAPFVVSIAEFKSQINIDPFKNTFEIIGFLKSTFNLEISHEEAYILGLQQIGTSSIPQSVIFYPKNFDGKQEVVDLISNYNKESSTAHQILYTDSSNALLSSLNSIINIISYVLIAFAGVSLVVSSIMIGIITYVSVIERTKEIGILRSIGARKIDVSRVFNAETIIIGFTAGVIGIVISYLLTIPINLIVNHLTSAISTFAILNPIHALILIAISIFLTFISGLIPASIASKKDPVVCLRNE